MAVKKKAAKGSAVPQEVDIEIESLVLDPKLRMRIDIPSPQRYAASLEEWGDKWLFEGPHDGRVIVVESQGKLYVCDGFTRTEAAKIRGLEKVPCVVFKGGVELRYRLSMSANAAHGFSLTPRDRRHKVLVAVGRWPALSVSGIANRTGINRSTVGEIMAALKEVKVEDLTEEELSEAIGDHLKKKRASKRAGGGGTKKVKDAGKDAKGSDAAAAVESAAGKDEGEEMEFPEWIAKGKDCQKCSVDQWIEGDEGYSCLGCGSGFMEQQDADAGKGELAGTTTSVVETLPDGASVPAGSGKPELKASEHSEELAGPVNLRLKAIKNAIGTAGRLIRELTELGVIGQCGSQMNGVLDVLNTARKAEENGKAKAG